MEKIEKEKSLYDRLQLAKKVYRMNKFVTFIGKYWICNKTVRAFYVVWMITFLLFGMAFANYNFTLTLIGVSCLGVMLLTLVTALIINYYSRLIVHEKRRKYLELDRYNYSVLISKDN